MYTKTHKEVDVSICIYYSLNKIYYKQNPDNIVFHKIYDIIWK